MWTGQDVLDATGGTWLSGTLGCRVRHVCMDSRTVRKGDVFVAMRGERCDGHHFVDEVVTRGARGVVVEATSRRAAVKRRPLPARRGARHADPFVITVNDTVRAYQDLAAFHRARVDIPVVAVTGSNGKTTTKEMVAHVLAQRWRVMKTVGNANNRIGLPRTVLGLTASHQLAVLEFGVDREGQTTRLAEIARPTIGVITNVGADHLESFGSVEGSARAKAELLTRLPRDGAVMLNADDPYYRLFRRRARCAVVSFGFGRRADIRGSHIQRQGTRTEFCLHMAGRPRTHRMVLRVHGTHNVLNALAAIAVGQTLGLSVAATAVGLSRFRPAAMRSQVLSRQGLTVIHDCYNANPDSMKAAVTLLQEIGEGKRTIAVLGDMLELGTDSPTCHEAVGAFLADSRIAWLIACGQFGAALAHGAASRGMPPSRIVVTPHVGGATRVLNRLAQPGDVVLLKASRGVGLERVLDGLALQRRPTHQ